MARSEMIIVDGTVESCFEAGLLEVCLSNGHKVLAHVRKDLRSELNMILPGMGVSLQLTPRDLSRGCIISVFKR